MHSRSVSRSGQGAGNAEWGMIATRRSMSRAAEQHNPLVRNGPRQVGQTQSAGARHRDDASGRRRRGRLPGEERKQPGAAPTALLRALVPPLGMRKKASAERNRTGAIELRFCGGLSLPLPTPFIDRHTPATWEIFSGCIEISQSDGFAGKTLIDPPNGSRFSERARYRRLPA